MIGFSQGDYEGLEDPDDMPNPRPCTVTAVLGGRSRTLEIPLPIRITPRTASAGGKVPFIKININMNQNP